MNVILTCVVKNILYDVLNLLTGYLVLWSPARVSVYSRNWTALEVAGFDVFKSFLPDGMDKEEGAPAHTVTLVIKVCVGDPSICRARAMMTQESGGLEGVSHHLSHHYEI